MSDANIVIEIEGGMVVRVLTDKPFNGKVMVLDRDEEDEDRASYSTTWDAAIEPAIVEFSPHVVSGIIKEWEVV